MIDYSVSINAEKYKKNTQTILWARRSISFYPSDLPTVFSFLWSETHAETQKWKYIMDAIFHVSWRISISALCGHKSKCDLLHFLHAQFNLFLLACVVTNFLSCAWIIRMSCGDTIAGKSWTPENCANCKIIPKVVLDMANFWCKIQRGIQ